MMAGMNIGHGNLLKVAVQDLSPSISTLVSFVLPMQSPLQPAKVTFGSGVAVRVVVV